MLEGMTLSDGQKNLLESLAGTPASVTESDIAMFANLESVTSPAEVVNEITEHFANESRPGSAAYMNVLGSSVMLNSALNAVGTRQIEIASLEERGFPALVDWDRTTPEMASTRHAYLTEDGRFQLLTGVNTLNSLLERHIHDTAVKAAGAYAEDLVVWGPGERVKSMLKKVLGTKATPSEIPFKPKESEMLRINAVLANRFKSRQEAVDTLRRELEHMMRQRPATIGLNVCGQLTKSLHEVTSDLGGSTEEPIDTYGFCMLHSLMEGGGMNELQIPAEYADIIERKTKEALGTSE